MRSREQLMADFWRTLKEGVLGIGVMIAVFSALGIAYWGLVAINLLILELIRAVS
jgi:hypothetical protein